MDSSLPLDAGEGIMAGVGVPVGAGASDDVGVTVIVCQAPDAGGPAAAQADSIRPAVSTVSLAIVDAKIRIPSPF